uniref:Uncharacterized protein n=1 Tax=Rhizophora mucronata TaxID=61149 RepID=A0A2P2NK42_RHIMU
MLDQIEVKKASLKQVYIISW